MPLVTRTISNAGAPLRAPNGDALAGVRATFTLVGASGLDNAQDAWDAVTLERVAGQVITVVTNAQGEFTVNLWPNSRGNRATRYLCQVDSPGVRDFSAVVEDAGTVLTWAAFMSSGAPLTPQEISQLTAYIDQIVAAQHAAEQAAADAASATATQIAKHVAALDPHPQYVQAAELAEAVSSKVDKITGKALSTNDYADADKAKLAGIAAGATANATDAQLRDRATHTGSQAIATVTGLQAALTNAELLNWIGL